MLKFLDDDDKPHDEARVNGYSFGDRLLEDVMFGAKITNGRVQIFMPKDSDGERYMKANRIGVAKWVKVIQDAADADQIDSYERLDGKGDLYLTDDGQVATPAPTGTMVPKRIMGTDLQAIVKSLKK
jgi:hypothetical protein